MHPKYLNWACTIETCTCREPFVLKFFVPFFLRAVITHFRRFKVRRLTQNRYENPLLLALADVHTKFKGVVASSLAALGQLDFAAAVQHAHSARELAMLMAKDAPKGPLAALTRFFCCSFATARWLCVANEHTKLAVFGGGGSSGGSEDAFCASLGRVRARGDERGFDWVLAASTLVPLFGAIALYLSRSSARKIKIT